MDRRTVSMVSRIARGLDYGTRNFMAIQDKKREIERQKERDAIDKRYKDALYKKTELELGDLELQNTQDKTAHEKALERMKGAAFTLNAIGGARNVVNRRKTS